MCVSLFTTNNIVVLNSLAQIEILGQKNMKDIVWT